jgi:hypothetical protein
MFIIILKYINIIIEMERKNLLFIKKNCQLSQKIVQMVDETYKVVDVGAVALPEELKKYTVPFLIVKNIIKPVEGENAITYLENLKFMYQSTNNITNKVVQMKPINNELDQQGTNKQFNKITDEYTFIEDGKNVEKAQSSLENLDDSKKIDFVTDYNNETKLKEEDTKDELKNMVLNRNRQLQLHLQRRR